jgi:hypothetical protein
MNVLLYAAQQTESGERLKQSIEMVESLESVTACWNLSQLVDLFKTPEPLPETVVLQAANKQELVIFESFRFKLEQVFFILVLPDADKETIATGHRLRPRFIAYEDSDFTEVGAVLEQLKAREESNADNGFRSGWME